MPRGKLPFTKCGAKRLADAARDAGLKVIGLEADMKNGTIRVLTRDAALGAEAHETPNPWDKVLPDAAHEKRPS
jgi:hypothetical protein